MTANMNHAPKTFAFTLLYKDTDNGECYSHEFFHHEEEIYGEELDQYLLLPATDEWLYFNVGEVDFEQVENLASYYEAIAVVPGHVDAIFPCKAAPAYNPKLNIFGKPNLYIVH